MRDSPLKKYRKSEAFELNIEDLGKKIPNYEWYNFILTVILKNCNKKSMQNFKHYQLILLRIRKLFLC